MVADYHSKKCLYHRLDRGIYRSLLRSGPISDINPDRIHLTVARHRRIRRAGGGLYVVHHQDLDARQVTWWQGIPTVNVPTAIAQCIASGVATYLIRQALDRAGRTSRLPRPDAEKLAAALEARDRSA